MAISSIASSGAGAVFPRESSGRGGAVKAFSDTLKAQIQESNRLQNESAELGKKAMLGNAGVTLHEAQIASAQADLQLRFLLQTRNRAVEAYKEIMSMPV